MGDDNPYIIRSRKGELVELPSRWQLDDWPQFVPQPRPRFHDANCCAVICDGGLHG